MRITIHDGYDTIGGNKISVCDSNGECFLLDFGLNFSRWGKFFEEFLNPRTGRIIEDLLKLNLLPRIPIYREDLSPSELSYDGRYRFVFLSHGHADHTGMVGLLSWNIPVMATPETLAILTTDSKLGNPSVWNSFLGKKRVKPDKPHIREDLRARGREPIVRRVVGIHMDNVELVSSKDVWDEMRIFKVYHSVLGASAIAVKVEGWWLVYTGDFRLGPEEDEKDFWLESLGEKRFNLSTSTERFLKEAKDLHPMVLIIEGTRVTREESERKSTERDVFVNSLSIISKHDGLVLVDFPVRHVERLFTFLRVSMETSRYLLLMPKDYAYLLTLQKLEPTWKLSEEEKECIRIYHPGKLTYIGLEREALERAMTEGTLVEPKDVARSPESFIFSCGYWNVNQILDLPERILSGSVYIHSSSEAYTEEQEIDVKRFANWLEYFSIKPLGIDLSTDPPKFTGEFHASGHASREDIERVISVLNPEIIVPVHTLSKEWFVKRWKDRVKTDRIVEL